jgi:hypothetical protein
MDMAFESSTLRHSWKAKSPRCGLCLENRWYQRWYVAQVHSFPPFMERKAAGVLPQP